jgi:DNA-directed RNA polymerase specialized sigma24 family protein
MAAPWQEHSRPRSPSETAAPGRSCSSVFGRGPPSLHCLPKDIVDAAFPQSQGNRPEDEFARLLERAQVGDPEAVGVLLSDLQKYLLKLAEQDWPDELRRRESPSELVQQALARVARGLPAFEGAPLQWRAWAAKILKNRMIQRRRFHLALRRNPSLEVPLSPPFAGSSANLPLAASGEGGTAAHRTTVSQRVAPGRPPDSTAADRGRPLMGTGRNRGALHRRGRP